MNMQAASLPNFTTSPLALKFTIKSCINTKEGTMHANELPLCPYHTWYDIPMVTQSNWDYLEMYDYLDEDYDDPWILTKQTQLHQQRQFDDNWQRDANDMEDMAKKYNKLCRKPKEAEDRYLKLTNDLKKRYILQPSLVNAYPWLV